MLVDEKGRVYNCFGYLHDRGTAPETGVPVYICKVGTTMYLKGVNELKEQD